MKQIEKNLISSFNGVKLDIAEIKTHITALLSKNNQLENTVVTLQASLAKKPKTKVVRIKSRPKIITVKSKTKKLTFIGSKDGKKFHNPLCPFAKNIKPKLKVSFSSKNTAKNKGYKPCRCTLK